MTWENLNKKNKKKIVVAVSGGFDPIHIGHVRLIQEAKKLGDKLIVILNNDNWLKKKKVHIFMHQKERKEIIESIEGVGEVVITSHIRNPKDMSVSKEILKIKPDIFANGEDRKAEKDILEGELAERSAVNWFSKSVKVERFSQVLGFWPNMSKKRNRPGNSIFSKLSEKRVNF